MSYLQLVYTKLFLDSACSFYVVSYVYVLPSSHAAYSICNNDIIYRSMGDTMYLIYLANQNSQTYLCFYVVKFFLLFLIMFVFYTHQDNLHESYGKKVLMFLIFLMLLLYLLNNILMLYYFSFG